MSASEASALFDVVGEGAPVGLALVDTELRFVRINSALCAINGRPRELHIGRRIDEVLPEMASVLGKSEPAVKMSVHRLLHQLQAAWEQPLENADD